MGREAYECVGGPLDGSHVRLAAADEGVFSKTEKSPSGRCVKHWYALLTRVDTIRQECLMFFSYRGTDRERIWDFPIIEPARGSDNV